MGDPSLSTPLHLSPCAPSMSHYVDVSRSCLILLGQQSQFAPSFTRRHCSLSLSLLSEQITKSSFSLPLLLSLLRCSYYNVLRDVRTQFCPRAAFLPSVISFRVKRNASDNAPDIKGGCSRIIWRTRCLESDCD